MPAKRKRSFLPDSFLIDSWESVKPYFEKLLNKKISSKDDLEQWLQNRSELDSVLQEDAGWRYIRMSCNTKDESFANSYLFFINEISPNVFSYSNELDKKLLASSFIEDLDKEKYRIYLRNVRKQVEVFREINIPLFTQSQEEEQKYSTIVGAMTVEVHGKEMTLQQANNFLKETDRKLREDVFWKISQRRLQDVAELNDLYTFLIKLRHEIAQNAGFENFRDYSFADLARFDYTPANCMDFHTSIAKEIVPIVESIDKERREMLQIDRLRPWDVDVDISGKPPLKPFSSTEELTNKTIECFYKIHPFLGECIEIMQTMKHFDLESRKDKAPGGFNYPLHEIGVPFIFMNATNSLRDLVTMVHEGGHAVHSFLSKSLELMDFKNVPSEVAELASMSMELISMEHWDVFFGEDDLKRAKQQQLEKIINVLPHVAIIDKFQHWVYTNPQHSEDERRKVWKSIFLEFSSNVMDWKGLEEIYSTVWQKQLHLYQVPFYYIEYGMAQLGAIAVWRNYKKNPEETLNKYLEALKLGYTKSIGEIYETAGIKFDFSQNYVRELADFVKEELRKLR